MILNGKIYNSPIGELLIVADQSSLIGLWFLNQKYFKRGIKKEIDFNSNAIIDKVSFYLDEYFKGNKPNLNFKINPKGTTFQKEVWKELLKIEYAKTSTYKKITQNLMNNLNIKTMSYRAIGNAISKNPISIIIPCHRVIAQNNDLRGYSAGIDKKRWLIEFEKENK